MTQNQLTYWANLENRRRNITDEFIRWKEHQETQRHDFATEAQKDYENMVKYYSYLEDVRSNQARESENYRHNTQTEALGWGELGEKNRHNIQEENISWFNAYENQRHNITGENINWFNAYENQRHNQEGEKISWYNAEENKRHNQTDEYWNAFGKQEQARHNVEDEQKNWYTAREQAAHYQRSDAASAVQAKASTKNADAAWTNAEAYADLARALASESRYKTEGQRINNERSLRDSAWSVVKDFTIFGLFDRFNVGGFINDTSSGFRNFASGVSDLAGSTGW